MKRRFVTEQDKKRMRDFEAAGKSRKEIAELMDLDPATVTRHLGPVRPYRGLRFQTA